MKSKQEQSVVRVEASKARQALAMFALSFAIYCLFVQITKTFL